MTKAEKDNVLIHSTSSVSIQVNSLDDDDQAFLPHSEVTSKSFIPFVINPHAKSVGIVNKIFVFNVLLAFLSQTLFLFQRYVNQDNNCIESKQTLNVAIAIVIIPNSIIFYCYILLKFVTAYVDPQTRVLVVNPKTIALNYLSGYFLIDFFVVLPLLQVIVDSIIQVSNPSSHASDVVDFLQGMALFCRILSMLAEQSTRDYVFESLSSKFVINLFGFFFFSHLVGSCWYYFALRRVEQCLQYACGEFSCSKYIHCWERNKDDPTSWKNWKNNKNATACFGPGGFEYGIYAQAVNLMKNSNLLFRYMYSLFWGFQQISTMAGNQTPAFFVAELRKCSLLCSSLLWVFYCSLFLLEICRTCLKLWDVGVWK